MYSYLLECNQDDKQKIEKYLLKSVSAGLHPERIDTVKYNAVYAKIKGELYEVHHNYWKDIDTTHFDEIENRVFQDQKYRKSAGLLSKDDLKKIENIEKNNEKYLLKFCQQKGFPFSAYPNKFKSYKIIDPTIIAVHATDSAKIKLINCAVKEAEKGKISWNIPVNISIALFSSEKSHKEVYPLWYLFYDNKENLKIEDSYLQLYSIKKLFDQDNFKKIKIQPSKYNKSDRKQIQQQLEEIEKLLIQDFSFSPENLIISNTSDSREINYRDIKSYKFTLSVL